MRLVFIVPLLFCVLVLPLSAQSDYALELTDRNAEVNQPFSVFVELTSDTKFDAVRVAVCHDPEELTLLQIWDDDYVEDLDGATEVLAEYDDGFTSVITANILAEETLPATTASDRLYQVRYEAIVEGTLTLELCETLGDPVVSSSVVVDGEDVETILVGAEIDAKIHEFRRGDCDGNGVVEPVTDAFYLLESAFINGPPPPCFDATDVDNNGSHFPLLDGLYLLQWAFEGEDVPADPGPFSCGPDPEGGDIGCETPPECDFDFEIPDVRDEDFELSMVVGDAVVGSTVDVEIRLDANLDSVDYLYGYHFSVCHDDLVSLEDEESVTESDEVEDTDTTYRQLTVTDEGWHVALVMNVLTGDYLELEEDMLLYTAEYDVLSAGDSEFTFCVLGSVDDDEFPIYAALTAGYTIIPELVEATVTIAEPIFKRGDADGDGIVFSILDGLYVLEWGFTSGPEPPCFDAADADDDGQIFAILEAITILDWGFTSGPSPPDPGAFECGEDPTEDELTCHVVSDGC